MCSSQTRKQPECNSRTRALCPAAGRQPPTSCRMGVGPGEPSDPAQKPPAAGPARAPGRGLCRTLPPEGLWVGRCSAPALTSPHELSPRTGHLSPDVATACSTQRLHETGPPGLGGLRSLSPLRSQGLAPCQPSVPPIAALGTLTHLGLSLPRAIPQP